MLASDGTPPGRLFLIASTLSFSPSTIIIIVSPSPSSVSNENPKKKKKNTIRETSTNFFFLIHFQALLLQPSLQRLQGSPLQLLLRRHMPRQCARPECSPPRLQRSTPGCRERRWRSRVCTSMGKTTAAELPNHRAGGAWMTLKTSARSGPGQGSAGRWRLET